MFVNKHAKVSPVLPGMPTSPDAAGLLFLEGIIAAWDTAFQRTCVILEGMLN